jgi:hypothetical protein
LQFLYNLYSTVGSALDRACKLEAILRTLSRRKKELRLEQSEIDNQFIRMLNSLQASLQNDEDLTVIVADTFSAIGAEVELVAAETAPPARPAVPDAIDRQKAQNAQLMERERTPPTMLTGLNARLGCFAGMDVFATDGTGMSLPELPSSSTFLEAFNPHPSASAMRAGAQAWRERHSQEARSGIDFRTGMSGHSGVLAGGTQSRHPHEYLNPQQSTGNNWTGMALRMSSHTGLSTIRNTPSNVRSGPDESRDQVQQAGSL